MEKYLRNPECECAQFKDINEVEFSKRKEIKDFWMKGYIYKNGYSKECECHKRYRLTSRYNILAEQFGLSDYETLSKLKYLGTGDSYKKLKIIPSIVEEKNLKNLLVFMDGPLNCQKTTSVSKLIYNLITSGKTVQYKLYGDLISEMTKMDYDSSDLLSMDWLFIDDCFEGETINFKNVYNVFYNLLLKRKKPTVIITSLSKEEILNKKDKPFYNGEMLNKLFNKVDKYKAYIKFNDNVDKILAVGSGPIDLWSL